MLTYVRQGYYTDPKTRLRYHNAEVYQIVKSFVCVEVPFADLHTFQQAPGVDNMYLALRGDASQLL